MRTFKLMFDFIGLILYLSSNVDENLLNICIKRINEFLNSMTKTENKYHLQKNVASSLQQASKNA